MSAGRSFPCASAIAAARASIWMEVTRIGIGGASVLPSIGNLDLADRQCSEPAAVLLAGVDAHLERQPVVLGRHPQLDARIAVVVVDAPDLRRDDPGRQL